MNFRENENQPSPDSFDEALTQALDGESLRAPDWERLANALKVRRDGLERELEAASHSIERQLLEDKIAEITEQIAVLREEAGISRFVEETVKFSYQVHKMGEG